MPLLCVLLLQSSCTVEEPEDNILEWEETREQLPEILQGSWKTQDEDAVWTQHFSDDGQMITLAADGDTIDIRPYELTDTCGPFEVPHASEVEEKHVTLKLIKQETDTPHRCLAIHWYEVDEDAGVERIGVEFLSGATRPQGVWERELR